MQRINPRPIFSAAIKLIESDRCPECGRGYDPVAATEDYCPRIKPLHCSWCSDRVRVIKDYQSWLRQDAAAHRAARKKKSPG